MIYVGIDDTDTRESRGTNQLARELVARLAPDYRGLRITRHQLLNDPRVPFTSKNGCASIVLLPHEPPPAPARLLANLAGWMRELHIPGSDPGLCVALDVPADVVQFGQRCQRELVRQTEARDLARSGGLSLVGLGGTEDGVIGALAAVGLAASDDDGRVVHAGDWTDEEKLAGLLPVDLLRACHVTVEELDTGQPVVSGAVDVGKKLRPNWRQGRCVLFVRRRQGDATYQAIKRP